MHNDAPPARGLIRLTASSQKGLRTGGGHSRRIVPQIKTNYMTTRSQSRTRNWQCHVRCCKVGSAKNCRSRWGCLGQTSHACQPPVIRASTDSQRTQPNSFSSWNSFGMNIRNQMRLHPFLTSATLAIPWTWTASLPVLATIDYLIKLNLKIADLN